MFIQNSEVFTQGNALKNAVCEMGAIFLGHNVLTTGNTWRCIQVLVSIGDIDVLVLMHQDINIHDIDSVSILWSYCHVKYLILSLKHFNPIFNSTKYLRLNTKYAAQHRKLFALPLFFIKTDPLQLALPEKNNKSHGLNGSPMELAHQWINTIMHLLF